jgi:hypothetical protein
METVLLFVCVVRLVFIGPESTKTGEVNPRIRAEFCAGYKVDSLFGQAMHYYVQPYDNINLS